MIRVKRAENYGYCSGVRVADLKVRQFASTGGSGAILGQVVHNERVVAEMEALGMRTVDAIEDATEETIVFSAHGVPPSFHDTAKRRDLAVLDTTCKFVYDIHNESEAALAEGCHLVFVGEPDHREVVGYTHDLESETYHVVFSKSDAEAVDWSAFKAIRVFYQTTLNAADFEEVVRVIESRCSSVRRADTICYATKENQRAARRLAEDPEVEVVLVIGGTRSANTRHLWEIAARIKTSHLIQGPEDIEPESLVGVSCVGLTAGASTPDALVDEVERYVMAFGDGETRCAQQP